MKNDPTTNRRPVLQLSSTPLESFLLLVALVGVVCCVAPLALTWSALPPIVPSHFDAAGRPNAYGSKSWLLLLPALSVILTVGFTILARYPHLFNYPVRVTPENAPRLYRSGRLLLRWMNVALTWVFAFIEWQTLQVVRGNAAGLPAWFLPVTLVLVVLVPLAAIFFTMTSVLKR